jgi:hypothetical protein
MFEILLLRHKVDRVLGFFSSHPNRDCRLVDPPLVPGGRGGGTNSLAGEGMLL